MIELANHALRFRFPEVHPRAACTIEFQRTLRIPDDNREYLLPPGLGRFPVEHVDDYPETLPDAWHRHGGVFIPMYQAEAMWIRFSGNYPCAVKIAAGKINAVSGKEWFNELEDDPQDYVVIPEQPWLDGFNVSEGHVRQFVAMPLGEGYTAEEQIKGEADNGGVQIIVYPMKPEIYEEHQLQEMELQTYFCRYHSQPGTEMGMAPGGLMKQKIHKDKYGIGSWDQNHGSRCFVHITNSVVYEKLTGHKPPHKPPTAEEYTDAGLPWFDFYSDEKATAGAPALASLSSVAAKALEKTGEPLQGNEPVVPGNIKHIGARKTVREGSF